MKKIQLISRIMKGLFWLACIGSVIFTIAAWATGSELYSIIHFQIYTLSPNLSFTNQPTSIKLYGFLLTLIPTILISGLFYFAARLFGLYQSGRVFEPVNARYVIKISATILLWIPLRPIYGALMSNLVTQITGKATSLVIFDAGYFTDALVGILFLVVGWVMLEAAKLNEEQKLTI